MQRAGMYLFVVEKALNARVPGPPPLNWEHAVNPSPARRDAWQWHAAAAYAAHLPARRPRAADCCTSGSSRHGRRVDRCRPRDGRPGLAGQPEHSCRSSRALPASGGWRASATSCATSTRTCACSSNHRRSPSRSMPGCRISNPGLPFGNASRSSENRRAGRHWRPSRFTGVEGRPAPVKEMVDPRAVPSWRPRRLSTRRRPRPNLWGRQTVQRTMRTDRTRSSYAGLSLQRVREPQHPRPAARRPRAARPAASRRASGPGLTWRGYEARRYGPVPRIGMAHSGEKARTTRCLVATGGRSRGSARGTSYGNATAHRA